MELISLTVVILITFIIILVSIYALWIGYEQWQYMHDPHKMLFLSSSNTEIETKLEQIIAKHLPETEDYNLVELGCGKAVVLKSLASKYQWKSVTGVEGQKSVWLQAWLNCNLMPTLNLKKFSSSRFSKKSSKENSPLEGWQAKPDGVDFLIDRTELKNKVNLLNQNIFDYKSQKPTFHYCYLGVKLMKELCDKGLFENSIVVSLDYEIQGVKPVEIIELETKSKIQNRLLIYNLSEV
jgi:hypothetical protein